MSEVQRFVRCDLEQIAGIGWYLFERGEEFIGMSWKNRQEGAVD